MYRRDCTVFCGPLSFSRRELRGKLAKSEGQALVVNRSMFRNESKACVFVMLCTGQHKEGVGGKSCLVSVIFSS